MSSNVSHYNSFRIWSMSTWMPLHVERSIIIDVLKHYYYAHTISKFATKMAY
jgi:hypothetical protein